mgnify:CR=1 FL=1
MLCKNVVDAKKNQFIIELIQERGFAVIVLRRQSSKRPEKQFPIII